MIDSAERCAGERCCSGRTRHPTFIKTPILDSLIGERDEGTVLAKLARQVLPLGCIGEADDVANGILDLASDESRFMTSAKLKLDGGFPPSNMNAALDREALEPWLADRWTVFGPLFVERFTGGQSNSTLLLSSLTPGAKNEQCHKAVAALNGEILPRRGRRSSATSRVLASASAFTFPGRLTELSSAQFESRACSRQPRSELTETAASATVITVHEIAAGDEE